MLSLTVLWFNSLVRSYCCTLSYRLLFNLVSMIIICFHSSFLKYLKYHSYPVLVDRSKSPIKYANLCTEENRATKNIYSIFIGLCIYILYIYLYSNFCSIYCFWTTTDFFLFNSYVNSCSCKVERMNIIPLSVDSIRFHFLTTDFV